MYCPKCGKQMKDGQEFCIECGTPIEAAQATLAAGVTETPPPQPKSVIITVAPKKDTSPVPKGKGLVSMIVGLVSLYLPLAGYGLLGVVAGIIGLVFSREPIKYKGTRAETFAKVGKYTSIGGIIYSAIVTIFSIFWLFFGWLFYLVSFLLQLPALMNDTATVIEFFYDFMDILA